MYTLTLLNYPYDILEELGSVEDDEFVNIDDELLEAIKERITESELTGHESVEQILGEELHNELLSRLSPDLTYNLVTQFLNSNGEIDLDEVNWSMRYPLPVNDYECTVARKAVKRKVARTYRELRLREGHLIA